MRLSLKLVIGAFSAIIIALTAIIALVITQSFTMGAIRDIGRDHAGALVKAASGQVGSFFDQAVIQCRNMQVLVHQGTWMLPTDTAAAGKVWYADLLAHAIAMNRLFDLKYFTNTVLWAADGSYFVLYAPIISNATTYYITVMLTAGRANPTSRINLYTANDSVASIVPPTATTGVDILSRPNWLLYQGLRLNEQVWAEVGFGFLEDLDTGLATLESALVNASGTRIAVFGVNFAIDKMRVILESANLTQNTQAFIFDSRNMLVATSHSKNVNKWRGTYNASVSYEPGCYNTSAVTVGVVCRYTAASYPFTPLQELYARRPQLLNTSTRQTTDGAEIMKLDGKTYYVYVAVVECSVPLSMKIVLLMPESDITGDVIKGRNIAIGVMCAVCVVAVIVACVFVALVLMPLEDVSDRMYDAAELNDTSNDEALSVLSEIAALQDSYHNLRKKLNEMKAFVPQTLLHAEDDDDGSTTVSDGASKPADSQSRKSRKSGKSDTASMRGGVGGQVGGRGLNVAASLVKKGVAVLFVNVRGFQASIDSKNLTEGLTLCSKISGLVLKEVREQKGVVAQFHGDHFLATFNAVSPAASPAKRAAIAAVKMSDVMKTMQLRGSFGVSFGTATCGNIGCSDLKAYSVVGAAVVQAAAMERLAKLFSNRTDGEIAVLATDKCSLECECELFLQAVDYVAMPQPMLVMAVMSLKSAKEDEWMYRLQEAESKDPYALVNNGFRALVNGDVEGAKSALNRHREHCAAVRFVGASQLEKKLQDYGKGQVDDVCPNPLPATDGKMSVTGYGSYFRTLF